MMYDVIIIGGGPAGYTAAERAGEAGLQALLIEKQGLGGICLQEGCIPAKTLLYSAKTLDTIRNAAKYGIEVTPERISLEKIIARKNKIIRKLNAGIRQKLKAARVNVVEGHACIKAKSGNLFYVACNGDEYTARNVILCTGSSPFIPPIQGLENRKYLTSKEALNPASVPESLVIIGAGIIGMEFASFYRELGASVTILEVQEEILPTMDKEIAAFLRKQYEKKELHFTFP